MTHPNGSCKNVFVRPTIRTNQILDERSDLFTRLFLGLMRHRENDSFFSFGIKHSRLVITQKSKKEVKNLKSDCEKRYLFSFKITINSRIPFQKLKVCTECNTLLKVN